MESKNTKKENCEKLRDTKLLFLVKRDGDKIKEICLAMKKRGFGANRWNGAGGKLKEGESVHEATKRETKEEIGVDIEHTCKVAELSFYFPHKPEWNQMVHAFFSEKWAGEPTESEEMKPQWFSPDNLPFASMWPDDEFWVPKVIAGKLLKASFVFNEGDTIQSKEINIVNEL